MNFNRLVEQALEKEWILILKFPRHDNVSGKVHTDFNWNVYYTIAPIDQMSEENKEILNMVKKMDSTFRAYQDYKTSPHGVEKGRRYNQVYNTEDKHINIFEGTKEGLEFIVKSLKENNDEYTFKRELNVDKETEQAWGSIADEL